VTTTQAASGSEQLDEMGPIDYILIEWPGRQPTGEAAPLILDLVDRGVIRILDVAFMVKGEDGSTAALEAGTLPAPFDEFDGASSGIIGADELRDAANALRPGTCAAVLIWENRWAAPVAVALRRSGGELVASGRIPTLSILGAIDAIEAA
jgi:hypothetical protein